MPEALERHGRAWKTPYVQPLCNLMQMRAACGYNTLMLRIERKAAISSILELSSRRSVHAARYLCT